MVTIPRLQAASSKSIHSAPIGPGVALANVVDFSPQGIKDIIAGDRSKGYRIGALTAAPTFTASPSFNDLMENIVGTPGAFKGAQSIERIDVTIECELAELTHENIQLVHPGLTKTDWMSNIHARLVVGTGNAQFAVTSKAAGVAGNDITLTVATPAGTSTVVAVDGTDITVTPAASTDAAKASSVVAAINAHAGAKALVQAGLTATSDGSGNVLAAAEAPLAGGAAGSRIGFKFDPKGYVRNSDYLNNFVMALEGTNTDVLQIYVVHNVLSTDDFSYQPDDAGNISSLSATFTGHIGDESFDPSTGVYKPAYEIYNLDVPAVV